MRDAILITGSMGLIGKRLTTSLEKAGKAVIGIDVRGSPTILADVLDINNYPDIFSSVSGIVHLAAVSRVVFGENNPHLCRSVNINGTREVLALANRLPKAPWVVYASSREVYGDQNTLPVSETAVLAPKNVYARSKTEAETIVTEAQSQGMKACIARFSNVYGDIDDYPDRVVPAFARAAATGGVVRVEGRDNMFDFTHVDDVIAGVASLIELLDTEVVAPPPIHFVTGQPSTLYDLAMCAIECGHSDTQIVHAPARTYDVQRFYGDPRRARELLGWQATTSIRDGFAKLVEEFSGT
jgi:nucleoside-diphosphate-sugar epimerase